jgi:hypothetical protein
MTEETQVQAVNAEGVSPQVETPNPNGVAQPTPVQQPTVDVEKLVAKYEGDIRNLKSSLQKREAQVSAEWKQRYDAIQNEMQQVRMSKMNEEERKAYEIQLQSEEHKNLQTQLAELQSDRQMTQATLEAYSFFIQQGVPAEKLDLTGGYEAVTRAGWESITNELARYRQSQSAPTQPAKPELSPLPTAPSVVTDKGTPAGGTTWAALVAAYGTREAVYRAVEEGRAPASIIPLE